MNYNHDAIEWTILVVLSVYPIYFYIVLDLSGGLRDIFVSNSFQKTDWEKKGLVPYMSSSYFSPIARCQVS